jgi:hypothetical protein
MSSIEPEEYFPVAGHALDIMSIAASVESSRFAYQARLAHALGLLVPLLAGQQEVVSQLSAGFLSRFSAGQCPPRQQVLARQRALAFHLPVMPVEADAEPSTEMASADSLSDHSSNRSLDRVATPG